MPADRLLVRDVIASFAPGQSLRAALLLTYTFDGKWLEEGFVPDLFDRPVETALVIRDANRVLREAPSLRYHRANACFSTRIFHPKLALFVAEDRALAIVGSANLTRGGLERNLELASAFKMGPSGGPRHLFAEALAYLEGPLLREVRGTAATSVRDTAVALSEVLAKVPKPERRQHWFLHNYEVPIWDQLLKLLPHRYVARLSIVSPFFEPNSAEYEDPVEEADAGLFERALGDLKFEAPRGEKPIAVFFQQSEGRTLLPVDKLRAWKDRIELYQRRSTSEDPRPLHGKLLIVEGAQADGRPPYVLAVYGSPNFTSAAFLSRPPSGNAEVAVATMLPAKRDASGKAWTSLGLNILFGKVVDWGTLRHVPPPRPPIKEAGEFRITDATLQVSDRKLELAWEGSANGAATVRVSIEVEGSWSVVGTAELGEEGRLVLDVQQLAEYDASNLLSLKSSSIRVELLDSKGRVTVRSHVPLNVDCPQQFCGVAMVGQLMSTLDERIAFAGTGAPRTYREQQKFLEQVRGRGTPAGKLPTVLTHQADLDRFFRNLQAGFRGVRARLDAMPNSEFTLRRTVKDLTKWCEEALRDGNGITTPECRLFLVDRLARELSVVVEQAANNTRLSSSLCDVAREFHLKATMESVSQWIDELRTGEFETYLDETRRFVKSIVSTARTLETS